MTDPVRLAVPGAAAGAPSARPAPDDAALIARLVARRLSVPRLAPVHLGLLAAALEAVALVLMGWFALFFAGDPGARGFAAAAALAALPAGFSGAAMTALAGGYALTALRRPRAGLLPAFGGGAAALWIAAIAGGQPPAAVAAPGLVLWIGFLVPLRACLAGAAGWAVEAGLTGRRAVIAGGGEEARRVVRGLAARPDNDIRVHAVFDDRGPERIGERVLDVPVIGRFDDLVAFCREAEIDLVLLTLPPDAEARIAGLMARFRVLPAQVHLTAWSRDLTFPSSAAGGSVGMLLPPSFRPERRVAKRTLDLVVGTAALLAAAPVMAMVAAAIRLDSPGPVFFRQRRHGYNNSEIVVWKFRTMHTAACDPAGARVVTRGDARVTRVGRVLRKTSLDELPQLFNVLSGSLSLVGPRPHALAARSSRQEAFEAIVDGYSARHRLPPGMTGWAQIHGLRGEIDAPESLRARVNHDLYYIENWSLWLDLAILVRTPLSLLDTRRAY